MNGSQPDPRIAHASEAEHFSATLKVVSSRFVLFAEGSTKEESVLSEIDVDVFL
jgi:hypothetical protein